MRYTEISKATPFEGEPKINNASAFGASAGKPILIRICASGKRPMTYGAENLPDGLVLENGIITGKVDIDGEYEIKLVCENELGRCEKNITLELNFYGIRDHRNYPDSRFWRIAGEEKCPVTFGFDAHTVESAYDGASLAEAKKLVEKYHLNYIGKPCIIDLKKI